MARKLRLEYRGAIYHVMNRGDRREDIFKTIEQGVSLSRFWVSPVKKLAGRFMRFA